MPTSCTYMYVHGAWIHSIVYAKYLSQLMSHAPPPLYDLLNRGNEAALCSYHVPIYIPSCIPTFHVPNMLDI